MRYFWTILWTLILVNMVTYVVSSMVGVAADFKVGSIIALIASVLILIIPTILPNDPVEEAHH